MFRRRYGLCSWFALLATLGSLLPPSAAMLAENRAITLQGEGGDAWTFEKKLEGELPDGGCDRVLIASPRATVEAWQAAGRFGAIVPLLEGDNEVRATCHLGKTDRSASQPQRWRVRLRDVPKAWIRIVPADDGILLDSGASGPAPARSAPIVAHQWRSSSVNPQPLTTVDGLYATHAPGHGTSYVTYD
jgi:cyclomaltodextrinase / maltogenic alpha-amylase / neopullulanase